MSNFYFPLEVIVEILQKLPVKSLVRCMCVCKSWKSIITTDSFITSHYQTNHANTSSLFFHLHSSETEMAGSARRGYSGKFCSLHSGDDLTDTLLFWESAPISIIGICNGLVCFADNILLDDQYVIWNPCILTYVKLPKPSLTLKTRVSKIDSDHVCIGFGFDSQNYDLKVVRFITPLFKEATPLVEIYSLASGSWRTITVAASPFLIIDIKGKFVNGVLHWVARRTINHRLCYFILTFDIVEEKIGELMLPQCLKETESPLGLCILTGGNLLALVHGNVSFGRVWIMKEYGVVESWNQLFHFDISSNENTLALTNSGEVVLESFGDGIIFRDPIKQVEKKLELENGYITFVDYYVESLFLVNEKVRTHISL